jgi:hypothetical protein
MSEGPRDDHPPEAYRIHSDVLNAEVWLVHRRLKREDYPTDGVCYTGAECEILLRAGPDVLSAVQLVKEVLGATVVNARRDAHDPWAAEWPPKRRPPERRRRLGSPLWGELAQPSPTHP